MNRGNFPGRKQKKREEAISRQKVSWEKFKKEYPDKASKTTFEEKYGIKK